MPFTPAGGPPQVPPPSREIFGRMGEAAIFRMLSDFYAELGRSPIRPMFPGELEESSKKSARFFVQLLGGPPLFNEQHGPPRLRARHLPFEIDESARLVWVGCFETTLEDAEAKYGFPPEHLEGFLVFLREFSKWMVNRK